MNGATPNNCKQTNTSKKQQGEIYLQKKQCTKHKYKQNLQFLQYKHSNL